MTRSSPSAFEPCAHAKLDFCGMIRFLWLALLLNAALAVLSDKGLCVCVCVCVRVCVCVGGYLLGG